MEPMAKMLELGHMDTFTLESNVSKLTDEICAMSVLSSADYDEVKFNAALSLKDDYEKELKKRRGKFPFMLHLASMPSKSLDKQRFFFTAVLSNSINC